MSIITGTGNEINDVTKSLSSFMKRFRINDILRKRGVVKKSGIKTYTVFAFLIGLVFTGKNLYQLIASTKNALGFGKDVVYRFINEQSVNWESLLSNISLRVIPEIKRLTSDDRRTALIIDDTPFYRDRSKKVELLSRFFDHAKNVYYKGYALLTLGWSDGQTIMPVDYRLVAAGDGEKLLEKSHGAHDGRSNAAKRRKQAQKPKTALMLDMLKAAKATAAECRYVLFDSWFSSPATILGVKALGYEVVARLKAIKTHFYECDGKIVDIKTIFRTHKKRRGMSRYLLSVMITIKHKEFDCALPAKLVFVRNKNKRNEWIALISTDASLSEEEIIALYGKRWDIEPFFKVCKSFLRLQTEFQSRSFDAISAQVCIVFTRYIVISLKNRENKDDRSVCAIFHAVCDELSDISFESALETIMSVMSVALCDYLHLENSRLNEFVAYFFSLIPAWLQGKLDSGRCES